MRRTVAKRLRQQAIAEAGSGNTSTELYYDELKKKITERLSLLLKQKKQKDKPGCVSRV